LYHTERTFKKRKNQTKGAFWAKKCKERDLTKWFNDEEISSCSCCINEVKKILGLIWVTGDGELYDTDPTDVKTNRIGNFFNCKSDAENKTMWKKWGY
jgi:hypothetical protein